MHNCISCGIYHNWIERRFVILMVMNTPGKNMIFHKLFGAFEPFCYKHDMEKQFVQILMWIVRKIRRMILFTHCIPNKEHIFLVLKRILNNALLFVIHTYFNYAENWQKNPSSCLLFARPYNLSAMKCDRLSFINFVPKI